MATLPAETGWMRAQNVFARWSGGECLLINCVIYMVIINAEQYNSFHYALPLRKLSAYMLVR